MAAVHAAGRGFSWDTPASAGDRQAPRGGALEVLRDAECRQAAAALERRFPRWLCMWGCFTRRFYAFPAQVVTAPGTVLEAATVGELAALMRAAELAPLVIGPAVPQSQTAAGHAGGPGSPARDADGRW
jgi:hypothetical protein